MSELTKALEEYLMVRRAVGYKLKLSEYMLRNFVTELDHLGTEKITTEAALAWATRPAGAQPSWWAQRLGAARCFARFLHAVDPAHEVPPPGLLTAKARRSTRHVYCEKDVLSLMKAAAALDPALRGATYATVIGLLAVSGMRVSEAVGLDRDDVDWVEGLLRIRHAKFDKHREVPLQPSTMAALATYGRCRDAEALSTGSRAFFVSPSGTRLSYSAVHETFVRLLSATDLEDRPRLRPRLHDLRHSFAMNTLADWHRAGVEVDPRLPQLSTYLGHVDPKSTYWYLHATPELMAAAAARLEAGGVS